MKYLDKLLNAFSRLRKRKAGTLVGGLSTQPPAHVRVDGDIARFIFKPRDLTKDGRPKPNAFQPRFHEELQRLEVSVCGLADVSHERVWQLGRTVRARDGLTAIAALRLKVASVEEIGLRCEPAPDPPDFVEHGVIVNWHPTDKSAQLDAQNGLVAAVPIEGVLRPG